MTPDQIAYLATLRAEMRRGEASVTIAPAESRFLQFAFQLPWEPGCWIYTPDMPWPPSKEGRNYLPPGVHVVTLRLSYYDAQNNHYEKTQKFKIATPAVGQMLQITKWGNGWQRSCSAVARWIGERWWPRWASLITRRGRRD